MHKDRSFTVCIQTKFNDHYFLYSLCTNCHWSAQSIWCSFCKYKFILIWQLLIVLDHAEFKFFLFADSATSYYCYIAALSAVLTVIIDDIMLLINYNYLSAENVSSIMNELKMTAEILHHWVKRLNINAFIALLALLLCLYQLHFYSLLCHYSEQ